jgi:hypothetical protein
MKTMLVRIKETDPRRGHVLRRFTYKGIRFQAGNGWYQVSEEVADYLKGVRQRANDPHSPFAFDVCTEKEARAMDKKEAEEAEPKRPADNARIAVARGEEPSAAGNQPSAISNQRSAKKKEEKKNNQQISDSQEKQEAPVSQKADG